MRFAELDAVTVDGFGTLLSLLDPVPALRRALAERGVDRTTEEVAAAFSAEVAHYRPRSLAGRDAASLAALRDECAGVFLSALGAALEGFADAFVGAITFEPVAGAVQTLERLRSLGLELALVANWDVGLHEHLRRLELDDLFSTVVTSAEAGAAKPDPTIFRLALERIGVAPGRALHVGDEDADRDGARAAGMAFRPAPLATAFEGWT